MHFHLVREDWWKISGKHPAVSDLLLLAGCRGHMVVVP